jgi:hypothetical protein
MSQSQVPTAPNLDILSETVTDTGAAAPSATAQMQAMLGELDKDAAQSGLIIDSASRSSPAERRTTTKKKAKPSEAAPSWSPVSIALIAGIVSVGIEVLSREAIWSDAAETLVRLGPARCHSVCGETDWTADHSTPWFNQMTTNIQLCL